MPALPIRVVSATVRKDGRLHFNQVKMLQDQPPAGVMLVGVDKAVGLLLWLVPQALIEQHAKVQHHGYSAALSFVAAIPPPGFPPSVVVPHTALTAQQWSQIQSARTNTMHRHVADLFGL